MRQYGEFAKDDKEALRAQREAKDTAAFFAAEKELDRLQDVIRYYAEKRARSAGSKRYARTSAAVHDSGATIDMAAFLC